jgi:hypothetical protein
MPTLILELSTVDTCAATACAYNLERKCHARAITIGDGAHPACDTFCELDHHVSAARSSPAGVGACKVEVCRHNRDLECEAPSIRLEQHSSHADCATFER